jgi:hypothetical protein
MSASTFTPLANAASSAARIAAALTIGDSNQPSDFFRVAFFLRAAAAFFFLFAAALRDARDFLLFEYLERRSATADARTKSLPGLTPALASEDVRGRWNGAGWRAMPRAIRSASSCR